MPCMHISVEANLQKQNFRIILDSEPERSKRSKRWQTTHSKQITSRQKHRYHRQAEDNISNENRMPNSVNTSFDASMSSNVPEGAETSWKRTMRGCTKTLAEDRYEETTLGGRRYRERERRERGKFVVLLTLGRLMLRWFSKMNGHDLFGRVGLGPE